jgi:5-methylcytosine-specific restriction protein B
MEAFMARYIKGRDSAPLIAAANEWVQKCLINDGSMFSDESLWTGANLASLDEYFVKRPDTSNRTFYEKLQSQLHDAGLAAQCLMAEMLWALLLFPSNISVQTKRESIIRVWSWSGKQLSPNQPLLADDILAGIGSCGMAINNHRWRELNYMIGMMIQLKSVPVDFRNKVFLDYHAFLNWIDGIEQEGDRQFRHMLRYFLFPDIVERISTNRDRRKILDRFGVAAFSKNRKWSDEELDDALGELRKSLEKKYDTRELDFYSSPLREVWKPESEQDDIESAGEDNDDEVIEDELRFEVGEPRNLILYGPPGTGKTYRLQELRDEYTDQPADVDHETWEMELVGQFGWRATIAAALALLGRPVKVGELIEHPLMRAKALQRERKTAINATTWAYLQEHTPLEVKTVNTAIRRTPAVFTKNTVGGWSLLPEWQELDAEATALLAAWRKGPEGTGRPIQRYRFVTFHPSYSYEDFVVGLRPVSVSDDDGQTRTEFRMVDGVFKQICGLAKANPKKRYALFIDEINRANIAKVFGELITLIEGDKRARYNRAGALIGGIEVQLPGVYANGDGEEMFGVPANLDIYATMNTADRSIALLDIALRRRFEFEALNPDYSLIDRRIDTVDLRMLLERINVRLEYLADRDKQIGHAYFNRVKELKDLQTCFKLQIVPLLQEYFFDDWGNVAAALSDRFGKCAFVEKRMLAGSDLFPGRSGALAAARPAYRVTDAVSWTAEAFRSIYETKSGMTSGEQSE